MLRDGSIAGVSNESGAVDVGQRSWQEIDRELRSIAKRRCALDTEELALLCVAQRREIWRHLGKGSFAEYLEDVLGYEPKTARERVRVALALDEMPVLSEALATGEQSYSAIRELTRIATPDTETAWRDAAAGKNLRQIEQLVAGHRQGDLPGDPVDPDLRPRIVRFEVTTATFARLRQAQQVLADECGHQLDDDTLIDALCSAVLDGAPATDDATAGRAKYQVMAVHCEACGQGWHDAGGLRIPVNAAATARAECDAQRVGTDQAPERATQDVAPKVRRFVWRRDRGRCCVPDCRAKSHLEVHHIVPRAEGGGHEAENLTLLCNGHHDRLHEGRLRITGRAPNLTVTELSAVGGQTSTPHVGHEPASTTQEEYSSVECGHGGVAQAECAAPESTTADEGCEVASQLHVAFGFPQQDIVVSTPLACEPSTPDEAQRSVDRIGTQVLAATPHVGRSRYEWVVMKTEAAAALTQAGFTRPLARAFVDRAATEVPPNASLEQLVRAALRHAREQFKL